MCAIDISQEELQTAVHSALSAWDKAEGDSQDRLDDLILVQERRAAMTGDLPATLRLATNDVLLTCLKELAQHDPASANILTWRFLDGEIVQQVANRLHLGTDQLKRRQNRAIRALTAILWKKEQDARLARAYQLEALLLPPSYHTLFGAEDTLPKLVELLHAPYAPWVIAVTGMGGIGKTSLVNAAVRQIIPLFNYHKIIWLTVPHAEQPAAPLTAEWLMSRLALAVCPLLPVTTPVSERNLHLRQTLKLFPSLVILDNLETELSADLLTSVHDLSQPSRFVLTNRVRPSSQATAYLFSLAELSSPAALALLRDQARQIGNEALAAAPEAELQAIYACTGGNPLTLKLVVGLSQDLALPHVLADLAQAQTAATSDLYRHIYWQAWQSLSQPAKTLLEVMPLAADSGATPEQLQVISRLEPSQMLPAIQELIRRSLLEVRGSLNERRYAIHSLTRTFLLHEISHWP